MTRTATEALRAAAAQSRMGPTFGVNECKMRTRLLYEVPSDGTPDATAAWHAADFKHPIPDDLADIPTGALVWWLGGTPTASNPAGHGHVAPHNGGGRVWSTDIKRPGRFDLVDIEVISASWPRLRLVGWSEDIDGVRVITPPRPPGRLSRARALLLIIAREGITPSRRARARRALAALRKGNR